ncbi:MAG: hypothetical protein QNK35_18640 [Bacteroides sp.]|nr:hypothetical protein [Bacteroides sp.]
MKNSIFLLAILALFLLPYSCNKEEPQPTSAAFTTNLQNNTQKAGEAVTFYLSNAEGEFLTFFKGEDEEDTFGSGSGTILELGTDSLMQTYYNEGVYTFSLVATSYGNWGTTVSQDVQSLEITITASE